MPVSLPLFRLRVSPAARRLRVVGMERFEMKRKCCLVSALVVPLSIAAVAGSAAAGAQLLSLDVSNDIAWTAGAATIDDEAARRVTLPATVGALDLGALPAAASAPCGTPPGSLARGLIPSSP